MAKVKDRVPMMRPTVARLEGVVSYDNNGIKVGDVEVPAHLQGKFLRRCEGYNTLQEAVDGKEIYLRGKPSHHGTFWFGLVSGEFRPITVKAVSEALGRVSSNCTV